MKKVLLIIALMVGISASAQDDKYITPDEDIQILTYDSSKGFAMSGYFSSGDDIAKGGFGFEYFLGEFSIGAKYLGGNNYGSYRDDHYYRNSIAGTIGIRAAKNLFIKGAIGTTAVEFYPGSDPNLYSYEQQPDEFYNEPYFDVALQLFVRTGDGSGRFVPEVFIGSEGAGIGIGFKF